MKTLYLLRHAKSDWADPRLADHDRPLNARGERAAATMANYWARRKGGPPLPELILCSTALRARDTLLRVMQAWPAPPKVDYEEGLYLCGEELLLDRVKALPSTVDRALIVGHNPDIQLLTRDLCRDGDGRLLDALAMKLPTCSFVEISLPERVDWCDLRWGSCILADFVRPRDLGPDGERLANA
ncbi:SixA phosphatase family protein [Niveispirillum irakense]|uniref:SixA phosphatase family protein n=1 Tax=Niveispirillum irakense TaxID=34011 RepID=UPI0004023089|nr:histidine phosphatase family protein [Niveispirillum irakense]